ncbi:MAG: DNA-directed RNA polymerase subunit omega, partial [Defluviitaleaceae bacterium]|nr:DNA-directed RNA polymerase subunit omega [Defluviitaleaceae bacterium]
RVTSRYTVVLAAAKRARQLTDGAHPLTYAPTDRAVSIAVKEMSEGKLRIRVQEDLLDGNYERMIKDQYRYRGLSALSKDDLREELKEDYKPERYSMDDDDGEIFPADSYTDDTTEEIEKDEDFGLYEDNEDSVEAFDE